MKAFLIAFLILTATDLAFAGDYRCLKIAYVSVPEGMVIAPGRNDGINRLYVAGTKPKEITWNGSVWDTLAMGETIMARSIATGFGRNDGVWRLYIGDGWGARLWEYSYEGGIWSRVMIDDRTGGNIYAVGLGDIKNDDTIRVVSAGYDSILIAYTYLPGAGTWLQDTLGKTNDMIMGNIFIGRGRNDDTNRVYAGGSNWAYECTFRGNEWNINTIFWRPYKVLAGCLKNDTINRLYATTYEYTWNGNVWVSSDTLDFDPKGYYVFMGHGRGDSINRLYLTGGFNDPVGEDSAKVYFYEYTYADTAWLRKELSVVIWNPEGYPRSSINHLVVGNARNDGKNRVYGSCGPNDIFEWEWDDTLPGVAGEPQDERQQANIAGIAAMPNPFRGKAVINYNLPHSGYVGLDVYDISGRLVSGNSLGKKQAGAHSFAWGGKNSQGRSMPTGVYFVSLCVDGKQVATVKMVKVR